MNVESDSDLAIRQFHVPAHLLFHIIPRFALRDLANHGWQGACLAERKIDLRAELVCNFKNRRVVLLDGPDQVTDFGIIDGGRQLGNLMLDVAAETSFDGALNPDSTKEVDICRLGFELVLEASVLPLAGLSQPSIQAFGKPRELGCFPVEAE